MSSPPATEPEQSPEAPQIGDIPQEVPNQASTNEEPDEPSEQPAEVPVAAPEEQPQLTATTPAPTPAPAPVKKSKPAKIEGGKAAASPGGIKSIINKAKGQATNAGAWIQSHPLESGLIGAGVALGSAVVGWVIFRALKGGKHKSVKGRRNHPRSIDVRDEIMADFPTNSMERRAILDEIDWDDEEFLEFLSLFPGVEDISAE